MTEKIVPHKKYFARASKYNLINTVIINISSILTLTLMLDEKYSFLSYNVSYSFRIFICVLIALGVVFETLYSYTFQQARDFKVLGLIDNSFDTSFLDQKSKGYFSNENLENGWYKMAVNAFENALFSSTISNKMLLRSWIWTGLVSTLLIISAAGGENYIFYTLIQVPVIIFNLKNSIKLTMYSYASARIYDDFKTLFNDLKGYSYIPEKKIGNVIKLIMRYETVIAWGSVQLSSKIFNEINGTLSERWEKIKENYSIQ